MVIFNPSNFSLNSMINFFVNKKEKKNATCVRGLHLETPEPVKLRLRGIDWRKYYQKQYIWTLLDLKTSHEDYNCTLHRIHALNQSQTGAVKLGLEAGRTHFCKHVTYILYNAADKLVS